MKLHLLGTIGYHPNDHRHTACLMLPEVGIILDAGTAAFRIRDLIRTRNLDVFLTHAHLDHVVGLTYFLSILHGKQVDRVRVHGDAEKLAAIDRHLFAPELFPVRPPFEFQPLTSTVPLEQGGMLTYFPLVHPGGAWGFRLDWPGHSMAYVTDTTGRPDSPYVEHIRGVDLLVHECNFSDQWTELAIKTGHSWTSAVAQIASQAKVKRLILSHVDPSANPLDPVGIDVARRIFPNVELAYDQMVVEF